MAAGCARSSGEVTFEGEADSKVTTAAAKRRELGQVLREIYDGGFTSRVVRRLEHQAVAEAFRCCERQDGRDKELIEEWADLLDTASAAVGRRPSSVVQLQRLLRAHGRVDLAKRVAGRARGRHAAAHLDPGLAAALQEALGALRLGERQSTGAGKAEQLRNSGEAELNFVDELPSDAESDKQRSGAEGGEIESTAKDKGSVFLDLGETFSKLLQALAGEVERQVEGLEHVAQRNALDVWLAGDGDGGGYDVAEVPKHSAKATARSL